MTGCPVRMDNEARRRRLVGRHHLGRTAGDLTEAVRDLVVLHSSDPTTPHLALWARVPDVVPADLDRALCEERVLWRLHAMRRTIWIALAEEAPVLEAAAGRKVGDAERRRLLRWLEPEVDDPEGWLDALGERVLDTLSRSPGASTRDLGELVDRFGTRVTMGSGKWSQTSSIGPRLLFVLAMQLRIVRGEHTGTWRSSQYAWARTRDWFDDGVPDRLGVAEAQATLARRYLDRFGPATFDDLKWWTGWTKTATRAALASVDPIEVDLDTGATGYATDDERDERHDDPVVTLLPSLDPTAMGWTDRDHYLDEALVDQLFDGNGNVGPTIWLNGRIVGGWSVRGSGPDAEVVTALLVDVGSHVESLVEQQAAQLTDWLDDAVAPRFPTPLDAHLAGR